MIIVLFVTFLVLLGVYITNIFRYWKKKHVPYIVQTYFSQSPDMLNKSYDYFAVRGEKYFGLYAGLMTTLTVIDLNLIEHILTKDFQYFNTRGNYYNEKADPLSGHLFNISGERWKTLREKFTPTFTSGKMKMMFNTLLGCTEELVKYLDVSAKVGIEVDIKEILACYTTDVIGSCALGLECNSFGMDNTFRKLNRRALYLGFTRLLKRNFSFLFPTIAKFFGVIHFNKEVSDFYMNSVKETVEYREKNNFTRKDFMQLFINMKNNKTLDEDIKKELDDKKITLEEIAAQVFAFFFAGLETSATTMHFCLCELSLNPAIQDKLRNEINDVLSRHDGKITYESVMEMKYLEQVIDETLRKYPPMTTLMRQCTSNYKIPGTDTVIDKGTYVLIPAYQIHHDHKYFPDPDRFKPERFSNENKAKRNPYTYLPFGEGPRNCIGKRFGMLQSKVGLAVLLRQFRFDLCPRAIKPLDFNKKTFVLATKKPITMKIYHV